MSDINNTLYIINQQRLDGRFPNLVGAADGGVAVGMWFYSRENTFGDVVPFRSVASEATKLLWLLRSMGVRI